MSSPARSDEDAALSATKWNTGLGVVGTVATILAAWWGVANPDWLLYVTVGEAVLLVALYVVLVRLKSNAVDLRPQVPANVLDRPLYLEFHDAAMKRLGTAVRELHGGHLRLFGDEVRQGQVTLVQHLRNSRAVDRTVYAIDLTSDIPLIETRSDYFLENEALIRSGGSVKRVFVVQEADVLAPDTARWLLRLLRLHQDIGVEVGLQIRQMIRDPQLLQDFIVFGGAAVIVEGQQAGERYEHGHSQLYFDRFHVEAYRRHFDTLWRGVVGATAKSTANRFVQQAQQLDTPGATMNLQRITRPED